MYPLRGQWNKQQNQCPSPKTMTKAAYESSYSAGTKTSAVNSANSALAYGRAFLYYSELTYSMFFFRYQPSFKA